MKAKKMLGTLGVIAGIGFGFVTINQPTMAHASYYSWTKTKAYPTPVAFHQKSRGTTAYMWDAHHTRKLHNLKNYPRTTWYLSQSVKMRGNIYYHVTSGNGRTTGYVWRGYLSKGVSPYAVSATTTTTGTTTSTTSGSTSTTPTTTGTTTSTGTSTTTTPTLNARDAAILAAFPGAKDSATLNSMATRWANIDEEEVSVAMDQERAIMAELPSDQAAKAKVISQSGSVSVYQDLTSGKLTYGAFIKADLAQQGINPADYSGWNIGVGSVAPNTGSAFIGYGDYSVILVPAS